MAKDVFKPTIYGVGYRGSNIIVQSTINGKQIHLPSYVSWRDMLKRCYSEKYQEKYPTYKGCSVAKEWLNLTNFKKWFDTNYVKGWQLDKDLLFPNNKVYSANTCVFVPSEINSLLLDCGSARGACLQGVVCNKRAKKFRSRLNINGKLKYLGSFDTEIEAYLCYRDAKLAYVPTVLDKFDLPAHVKQAVIERTKEQLPINPTKLTHPVGR